MRILTTLILAFSLVHCSGESDQLTRVSAEWEYRLGAPDEEITSVLEGEYLPLDKENKGSLHKLLPGEKGFVWLRTVLPFTPGDPLPDNLSITLGRIAWSDQTYLNGVAIGKTGDFPPRSWSYWNSIREYHFPSGLLGEGTNLIHTKIYIDGEGFIYDDILWGKDSDIKAYLFPKKLINNYVNFLVSFLFFIIAIYHFLIYWKRKKDIENYYYSVFAILYSLYSSNFFSEIVPSIVTISYLLHQKFIILIQAGMVYYLARFFTVFFRITILPWIRYAYMGLLGVSVVVSMFIPEYKYLHEYRGLISLIQFTPALFFLVYSLVWGFRDKNPSAKAMVYGMIPLLFVVIHDTSLVVFGFQDVIFLASLGLPLFLGSIMFILAGKFVAVQNETDELNANLERKVEERTAEVTERMEEIQKLKVQQDGDYFLTSLIGKPLNTNFNKSRLVSTESLIRQKKKFSFRNKNAELGGDLCITGNLRFQDGKDRWIVAFNADAMGKSMQGAGGAIVAGTAMNNIMGRSARNDRVLSILPEEWVAETYKELDSIFKTFNGSMLISCAFGLINERTGDMFYFNAEHPWTVVYRDGKASFIENELLLRKLGSESEFPFEVRKFKLLPGDVLFMGSDGRDDINLGATGERLLNEDETLFLRLVEESNGDIKNLAELVEFQGELTDDLSLIRIGFQEEFSPQGAEDEIEEFNLDLAKEEIQKNNLTKARYILDKVWEADKSNTAALKMLIKVLFDGKKFGDTVNRINEFHKIQPETQLFWFEKSVCYKQLQDFESAKSSGEVCKRFQPKRVANLINLADSYRMLGDMESARSLLKDAIRLEPQNEAAAKLAGILAMQ